LHDHTSSPVLGDTEKTVLCPSAARCAGRLPPTDIFLGVTELFCGTSLTGELLEMIGNFTDGNLWSVTTVQDNHPSSIERRQDGPPQQPVDWCGNEEG